jgi:hypothetical protein
MTDKPLAETLPLFSYMRRSIEDMNRFTREELGAGFMVVVFPRSYQYSAEECPDNWEKSQYEILGRYAHEPFKYFDQMRGEVDYPVYSLLADFQNCGLFPTCFENDPHWNEAGNRIAADAIYRCCLEAGYFD